MDLRTTELYGMGKLILFLGAAFMLWLLCSWLYNWNIIPPFICTLLFTPMSMIYFITEQKNIDYSDLFSMSEIIYTNILPIFAVLLCINLKYKNIQLSFLFWVCIIIVTVIFYIIIYWFSDKKYRESSHFILHVLVLLGSYTVAIVLSINFIFGYNQIVATYNTTINNKYIKPGVIRSRTSYYYIQFDPINSLNNLTEIEVSGDYYHVLNSGNKVQLLLNKGILGITNILIIKKGN